jgi:DNA polymerase-1
MTRTLLIDADIIAYQSTAANERKYDWGDGVSSKVSDFEAAKRAASDQIEHLADTLKADALIICLSDDVQNFREQVWPRYKQNRTGTERPEYLYDLKEWFGTEYQTAMRPRLEADDVMGILSTEPHEGQRIIVSADKDMQTVPGWLFNPNKDKKPRLITPEQAERFMLYQALIGDQTDGYPGCPGCGPKAAEQLLSGFEWYRHEREITRGKRAGEIEVKWSLADALHEWTPWSAVLSAYFKAGQTEKDAVTMVNLARILKHSDLDGNRIIPWVPKMIRGWAN